MPEGEVGVIPPVEGVEGGVVNEGVDPPASCSRGSGVVGVEESLWQTLNDREEFMENIRSVQQNSNK